MRTRRQMLKATAQAAIGLTSSSLFLPSAQAALRKPIPFGAAINPYKIDPEATSPDPAYGPAYALFCDLIVAETGMKMPDYWPKRGEFRTEFADIFTKFGEDHGLKMRGHALIWDCAKNNPEWVNGLTDSSLISGFLREHVTKTVGHSKGRMISWDVINEPLTTACPHNNNPGPSIWKRRLGNRYMVEAFKAASEADKQAQLVINEVDLETKADQKKRDQLVALVRELKGEGAPIDAVGMQCHLGGHREIDSSGIRRFVADLKDLRVDVLVTELDVKDYKLQTLSASQRDIVMANKVRELLLAVDSPTAVLTWGLTDKYSLLRSQPVYGRSDGRPLPLDEHYQRKHMMDAIKAFCRGQR